VRHRKAFNGQISKFECRSGVEDLPVRLVLQFWLDGFSGHDIGEYDRIEFLGECRNTRGVIAVFVGDENGVDLFWSDAAILEHAADTFAAETSIYEDFAVFRNQEAAIAGTATAEDRELHGHRATQ